MAKEKNTEKETSRLEQLKANFPFKDIEFRPARFWRQGSNVHTQLLAYITGRAVMNRLDEVVGAENWTAKYELLNSGGMRCTLSLRIDGEWISKEDFAEYNEDFPLKGVASDALKRAAVNWGIFRYGYELGESNCLVYSDSKGTPNEIKVSGKIKNEDKPIYGYTDVFMPDWALLPEDIEIAGSKAIYPIPPQKLAPIQTSPTPAPKIEQPLPLAAPVSNSARAAEIQKIVANTASSKSIANDPFPYHYRLPWGFGKEIIEQLKQAKQAKWFPDVKQWRTSVPVPDWAAHGANTAAVTNGAGLPGSNYGAVPQKQAAPSQDESPPPFPEDLIPPQIEDEDDIPF